MNLQEEFRKYIRTYPQWRFAPPRKQVERILQKFGSEYGGYFVDRTIIHENSVVYSLGIGEDISFDLSLIENFGVNIEAFDPTPKVQKWLASQSLPTQFHFHATGIADFDGQAPFYLPPKKEWISHSIIQARQYSRDCILVPMKQLSTAMKNLGHEEIDLLKMDIEGAEYGVIEEIVQKDIPVRQLVVEFHHRLSSIGTKKTRRVLSLLENYGMKICHICPRKEVFTLVKDQVMDGV